MTPTIFVPLPDLPEFPAATIADKEMYAALQQVHQAVHILNSKIEAVAVLATATGSVAGTSPAVYFGETWPAGATAPALLVKYLANGAFDDFEVM